MDIYNYNSCIYKETYKVKCISRWKRWITVLKREHQRQVLDGRGKKRSVDGLGAAERGEGNGTG